MFFTRENLANPRTLAHWGELWANRDQFNINQGQMVRAYRPAMTPAQLECNALAGLGREFWAEVDSQVIQMRDQEIGMEIVTDLMSVQSVLSVGKTAKLYNIVGDIADDVSVSLDGQAPYSFDHTEYDSDGDPIPIFSAGYGVNWRHGVGLNTVGIDLVLDSQEAKLRKFNKRIVSCMLDGDARIVVQKYPAQGLRNHRNTIKLNLGAGAGGANIDLTSANAEAIIAFFGVGAFGQAARVNKVAAYDVLWVSQEISANLNRPYVVNNQVVGTVLSVIMPFIPARAIRPTYALKGNEILGYVRQRSVLSPLVGMTTGVTPLPRPLPQTNFNFQILAALGLQVKRDGENLSGVIYGANLA